MKMPATEISFLVREIVTDGDLRPLLLNQFSVIILQFCLLFN